MANQWNVTSNGPGILLEGLAWNPYSVPGGYNTDGLGILTFGFVWGIASIWAQCSAGVTTEWEDCACTPTCT